MSNTKDDNKYTFITYPDPSKALGKVFELASYSKTHDKAKLIDVFNQINNPIRAKSYIVMQKDGLDVGFACWAMVDAINLTILNNKSRVLMPEELKSGNSFTLITAIAPFEGGKELLEWLIDSFAFEDSIKEELNNIVKVKNRR